MKTKKLTPLAALLVLALAAPVIAAPAATEKTEARKEAVVDKNAPKPGTIAAAIKDGVTFSILNRALAAADLTATLGGKGTYTVFAPTDEAFGKLPAGTLDKLLLPENKEKLRVLLMYHILPGQLLSTSLTDGELKTSSGDKVKIDVDGTKIEIAHAKVVNPDVVTTNGVIHVIDKVLVPKSLDDFAGLKKSD